MYKSYLKPYRQYKQKAAEESKRKKRLKVDSWELVNDKNEEDDVMDIRDIEFRMTNDAGRIRALVSGASASSGRDLIMLKVGSNEWMKCTFPHVKWLHDFFDL